jgi:hypothetical protein
VANALNVFRNADVGFIGRLDSGVDCSLAAEKWDRWVQASLQAAGMIKTPCVSNSHDWRSSLTRSMNAPRRFTRSSEIAVQGDYFLAFDAGAPFIVAHLALLKLKYRMPRKRLTLKLSAAGRTARWGW